MCLYPLRRVNGCASGDRFWATNNLLDDCPNPTHVTELAGWTAKKAQNPGPSIPPQIEANMGAE